LLKKSRFSKPSLPFMIRNCAWGCKSFDDVDPPHHEFINFKSTNTRATDREATNSYCPESERADCQCPNGQRTDRLCAVRLSANLRRGCVRHVLTLGLLKKRGSSKKYIGSITKQ
jgi:hypothetical protein